MSTPASKRRRFDSSSSSSALHRPFRTPLKKPEKAAKLIGTPERGDNAASITSSNPGNENCSENTDMPDGGTRGCVLNHNGCKTTSNRNSHSEPVSVSYTANSNTPEASAPETPVRSSAHGQPNTPVTNHIQRRHHHHVVLTQSYSETRKPGHVPDPDIAAAQKEQRALEQQQRSARADIDVLEQALRVTRRRQQRREDVKTKEEEEGKLQEQCNANSKRSEDPGHEREVDGDARLENLIVKWRGASRRAVEEVFAGAQDRVNRMGGVAAWKERERERLVEQQQDRGSGTSWGWDVADAAKNSDGRSNCRNDDDDDDYRGHDEDQGEGVSEYDRMAKEEEEEERALQEAASGLDGNTFTTGMMLRSLNIDPCVIGFDEKADQWIDENP